MKTHSIYIVEVNVDLDTCTAKVLCENNKGKCSGNALCAVIDDEEVCFCPVGFQLTPGGTECIGKASTKIFSIHTVFKLVLNLQT